MREHSRAVDPDLDRPGDLRRSTAAHRVRCARTRRRRRQPGPRDAACRPGRGRRRASPRRPSATRLVRLARIRLGRWGAAASVSGGNAAFKLARPSPNGPITKVCDSKPSDARSDAASAVWPRWSSRCARNHDACAATSGSRPSRRLRAPPTRAPAGRRPHPAWRAPRARPRLQARTRAPPAARLGGQDLLLRAAGLRGSGAAETTATRAAPSQSCGSTSRRNYNDRFERLRPNAVSVC